MLTHKIIYVHKNGVVEGFIGKGSTVAEAYKDAINKIKDKLNIVNEEFNEIAIKKDFKGLTLDERKKVSEDFKKYI